jgi:hypothetical protein
LLIKIQPKWDGMNGHTEKRQSRGKKEGQKGGNVYEEMPKQPEEKTE